MTTARPLGASAEQPGGDYSVRLAAEYQRSRTDAAATASRLAFLCHSPDASPAALAEAAQAAISAASWLARAAGLTVRAQ